MEEDPFLQVKGEVVQQTASLKSLHARWKQLMKNPQAKKDDGEFGYVVNELQGISQAISWDLSDLSETIRIVEANRQKFKISDNELKARKQFIDTTKGEVEMIRREMNTPEAKAMANRAIKGSLFSGAQSGGRLQEEIEMDNEQFIQAQLQQTREMEREQEKYLDEIATHVGTIGQIGEEMSEEIGRQNTLLDELSKMSEETGARIRRTMKDIDKFLDESNNSVSWGIIVFLVLVVFGLLMGVIYL